MNSRSILNMTLLGYIIGCTKGPIATPYDAENPHVNHKHTLIDKQCITDEIMRHQDKIASCYKPRSFTKVNKSGLLVVNFVIHHDGTVSKAILTEDEIKSPKFATCILNVFMEMQFPSGMQTDIRSGNPDSFESVGVHVSFPLRFSSE